MPSEFVLQYALLVFLSAIGALQFVAARSRFYGLLFFRPWPRFSALLGILLVAGTFAWFFLSQNRNSPDTVLGLDGNAQARWFAIGGALAVAVTLALSSAVNHRWGRIPDSDGIDTNPQGLDALRRTTFARALFARARSIRHHRMKASLR